MSMIREVVTVLVCCVLAVFCVPLADFGLSTAFSVWLFLVAGFVIWGLRQIPAKERPHKGILMFLGVRLRVELREGWNFFPLYPLFDFILVKVEKENFDLGPQVVRTPDRAEISMRPSCTFTPGIKNDPGSLIEFQNSGGVEGVKRMLGEVIEDRMKTWAGSNSEGPSTWMEALVLRDDAHAVLCKAILGDTLTPVGSDIPTSVWMRYLSKPKLAPTEYDERNGWGKRVDEKKWNWDGLDATFGGKDYSEAERDRIRARVEERREVVRALREARGEFPIKKLGITLNRFSVPDIKPAGAVAKTADRQEKENQEQKGDEVEIKNMIDRITEVRKKHPQMSVDEAARNVRIILGKAEEKVVSIPGLDALLAAALARLSPPAPTAPPTTVPGSNPVPGGPPAPPVPAPPVPGPPQPTKPKKKTLSQREQADEFAKQKGEYPPWDPDPDKRGKPYTPPTT